MVEVTVSNFINGKYEATSTYIDSYDPSTGEVWAKIPDSGQTEVDLAVKAATQAFDGWSSTPPAQRSKILNRIADILERRLDEFAELESRDQGKPVWLSKAVDIPRAVYNFRFFASSILYEVTTSSQMESANAFNYTVTKPVGVAGLITPWNLPLYLLTFKVAPAIAFGNTCVVKPSEMTSVSAFKLCEIFNEAGLPAGVVNMVFGVGPRAGEALVKHPNVPLISFTGGTVTAEKLRIAAAPFCKKFSLELGGKNPAVIFSDVDLESCVQSVVRSSFSNQGEICLCTSRVFVQRELYPKFLERFIQEVEKLKVGDPTDKDTFVGALISREHLEKVKRYVSIAVEEGATCHHAKAELVLPEKNKNGYYMQPVIVTGVTDESRLMQEEIFGPVTCVVPFDTEEEVIKRANGVKFGLCAVLWTKDVNRLHRVAKKLEVGTVWINCWLVRDLNMPFGGIKDSGIGLEGAKDSLDFFTNKKTICVKLWD
ncbi:2-aminomuconic semialdehyde dehydrogenase-like [Gigantopelta aegis]|uniref:2-aminomuconic semialdehyde dehydrogenase-like n=1 Tax=Gigantopelta aegis TaxID=1735272 RepID=UPI001B888B91|nr:2-aminomuconic semialdehyde dehydrogenase-like [Gigantopelta aegis]